MLFCFVGLLTAHNIYAQKTLIHIDVQNKTVEEVLDEIERSTEFTFFYNTKQVDVGRRVSLRAEKKDVFHVLNEVFRGTGISYQVMDKSIILTHAPVADLSRSAAQPACRITGKVVDEQGEPVIGATATIKGTDNGTITDVNGTFSLTAADDVQIEVSFVGYRTQTLRATGSRPIHITLAEDTKLLSEVVVVGYGTQRKENLTGAVSTVDVSRTLENRPIPDIGRGLQGVVPGFSVTVPDSEIGSDPKMKIRGAIASLEGSADPLILVDNVEIPSIQVLNPDDIESISVLKDAASTSIYGAKAAFGVVLITTKKGAKSEKVTLSYSGNFSWQTLAKKYEMAEVEGLQYMLDSRAREKDSSRTGHYSYDGLYIGAYVRTDEESLALSRQWQNKYGGKIGPNDPYVYGRDWYYKNGQIFGIRTYNIYDYMIRDYAPSNQHNISISGRVKTTTFNIGLGYLGQSGMLKTTKDDFTKYNLSFKLETEVTKWLSIRGGTLFSVRTKQYPFITENDYDTPWLNMYRWSPLVPLGYNEDGEILRSPMSETMQAATGSMKYNYTNVNLGATVSLLKGWKANLDYTYSNQEYIQTLPGATFSGASFRGTPVRRLDADGNEIYVNRDGEVVSADTEGAMLSYKFPWDAHYNGTSKPNLYKRRHENGYQHTLNAYTDYTLDLERIHSLKFMLGLNLSTYDMSGQSTQVTDLSDFNNPQFAFGTGTWTGSGSASWQAQLGYFGRVNYSLKDRYLLEANLRYDGTSKFPTDLRWRWFPSFSAGWRVSEEAWMQFAQPVMNSLKIRGSWGTIGDQSVSSSLYIPTMSTGQSRWINGDGKLTNYVGTPSAVSASITWQDITTLDMGVDARFWGNRIGVSFDWFQRDTRNMIVPTDGVNTTTYGGSAPKANNGSLRTRGWEIAVDFNHRFRNGLGVNLLATVADALTTITKYGDTQNLDDWYVGKQYGEIWGFRVDRLYQWSDFETDGQGNLVFRELTAADTSDPNCIGKRSYILKPGPNGEKPVYQSYYEGSDFYFGPGDVKFVDVNGDGHLDKGTRTVDDHGDLVRIGNTTPRFEYGFRVGADWKGVDISAFFQGVGRRQIWGDGPLAIPGWKTSDGAMAAAFAKDYWTIDNPNAFYPAAYNMYGGNSSYNMNVNDRYLLNMAYLRLKNLTVGYTCPVRYSGKLGISKARVYFSAENLLTWDNLRGLPIDPEVVSGASMWGNNLAEGRTGVSTPAFKTLSVGVQLTF
ncbi:MAG: TonB-dependent receptor [Bacteroides sp.]|nr:TonB-dependent receptor [Bacteroides sp.]